MWWSRDDWTKRNSWTCWEVGCQTRGTSVQNFCLEKQNRWVSWCAFCATVKAKISCFMSFTTIYVLLHNEFSMLLTYFKVFNNSSWFFFYLYYQTLSIKFNGRNFFKDRILSQTVSWFAKRSGKQFNKKVDYRARDRWEREIWKRLNQWHLVLYLPRFSSVTILCMGL